MKRLGITVDEALVGRLTSLGYAIRYRDASCIVACTHTIACRICRYDEVKKYRVEVSTIAAFDRWANSAVVTRQFDRLWQVVGYLKNNQLQIHRDLLEYLSNEHMSLERECQKMREQNIIDNGDGNETNN